MAYPSKTGRGLDKNKGRRTPLRDGHPGPAALLITWPSHHDVVLHVGNPTLLYERTLQRTLIGRQLGLELGLVCRERVQPTFQAGNQPLLGFHLGCQGELGLGEAVWSGAI